MPRYRQELAASHNNLGALFQEQGRGEEAEAAHRQALAIQEKLVADFPAVPAYSVALGGSFCNFGEGLRKSRVKR